MHKEIIKKIRNKEAVIGIVGLGYVGIPLWLRFSEAGFNCIGFDNNSKHINILKKGRSTISHIHSSLIKKALDNNSVLTTEISDARKCDALIICLPTPLDEKRNPDLSFILNLAADLEPYFRKGQIISLESTSYPGTTEEKFLPLVEKSGLKIGEEIFLAYSPEREDPGNTEFTTKNIPKLCSGISIQCKQVAKELYESVIDEVVLVESTKIAEMAKLLENIHRAVNIGLVNEMKIVAEALDIDIYDVINAAATKPFGFTPYYPGPGLGGHCLPIDPFYLAWKASELGVDTRFIRLAGEINAAAPARVVNKLEEVLNLKTKNLNNAEVLVLGLAYKKNIDDARESPSYEILKLLEERGAKVNYSDPYIPTFPKTRKYNFDLKSIEITKEKISIYDAVILATDHDKFDLSLVERFSQILIDTRGVCSKHLENVIRA